MLVQRPSESVYRVPCRCPCHSNRPNWKRCRTVAVPVPTSYCSRVRLVSDWSTRSTERQVAPWRLISRPLRPWPGCHSRPSTPKPEPTRKSRNLRPTYWCLAGSIRGKKVTDRSGSECRPRRARHPARAAITTAPSKRRKRAVGPLHRWCWLLAKVNGWRAAAHWPGGVVVDGSLRIRPSTRRPIRRLPTVQKSRCKLKNRPPPLQLLLPSKKKNRMWRFVDGVQVSHVRIRMAVSATCRPSTTIRCSTPAPYPAGRATRPARRLLPFRMTCSCPLHLLPHLPVTAFSTLRLGEAVCMPDPIPWPLPDWGRRYRIATCGRTTRSVFAAAARVVSVAAPALHRKKPKRIRCRRMTESLQNLLLYHPSGCSRQLVQLDRGHLLCSVKFLLCRPCLS